MLPKEIDRAEYYANFNAVKVFGDLPASAGPYAALVVPDSEARAAVADRTTTYSTGMKMMFRKVDTNIPPATAVPTE